MAVVKGDVGASGYDVVVNKVLQKTDLDAHNNKFYAVELHSVHGGVWRVFTHYGRTERPEKGARESRQYGSEPPARKEYERILREKTGRGYVEVSLASSRIGSAKAAGAAVGTIDSATAAKVVPKAKHKRAGTPPEVLDLVSRLYANATGGLAAEVNVTYTAKGMETPLGVLTLMQIERGESVLDGLLGALGTTHEEIQNRSNQFYSLVPHKLKRSALAEAILDTPDKIAGRREVLQTMRDMLQVERVGGGGLLASDDLEAKYAALGCRIGPANATVGVDAEKTALKFRPCVRRAWTIERETERAAFETDVGGVKRLLHGSHYRNWVGLLSRGILMPKAVVKLGVKRTDAGWLGSGIYFGSNICTSHYYAAPGAGGVRYIALAEVALGRTRDYHEITYGLTAPPAGYDSVRGARSAPGRPSQFADEELVVYRQTQQQLTHLLEVV